MRPTEILQQVSHRPWPLPSSPWAGRMRWLDLAFLHWPIDPAVIRPHVPAGLELDLFAGQAWVGVVPFRMEAVRVRLTPPVPGTAAFAELNVRTYARVGARTGVWFFSLDAASRLAVRGARLLFNLPYFDATITLEPQGQGIEYDCRRIHAGAPPAVFRARYSPSGAVAPPAPGTLEHFLAERYCLFTEARDGALGYIDVHHLPWPLQTATASLEANTMAAAAGLTLPDTAPLVHFARTLDVVAWNRRPLTE